MKKNKVKSNMCNLCKTKIPHLLVTVKDGDMHVHAPFQDEKLMDDMIATIQEEWQKYKDERD